MGIIDDLAMGLGMKARTEDYDARTAATLRRDGNEQGATQYLQSRGRGADYSPVAAQDNRPLMQRLLFSQQGAQSPTPYAVGPMQMDQALPALGPLGLLMRFMSGGGQQEQDPRVAGAIADLQNKSKWMAGYGNQGGGVAPTTAGSVDVPNEPISNMTFPMLDEYNVPPPEMPRMTFPMLDEYNVPSSTPTPPASTMMEPYINFAQYVDAYRRKESPLLKSGRLKQGKSLQALQRSYNEQFGIK